MLTIKPFCNSSNDLQINDDSIIESDYYPPNTCDIGCSCNRLHLYVKSCPMKNCKIQDKFPSEITGSFIFLTIISKNKKQIISTYILFFPFSNNTLKVPIKTTSLFTRKALLYSYATTLTIQLTGTATPILRGTVVCILSQSPVVVSR